ncbi:DUF742 domain-containing protein [Streptosporangiaceae bacterium NEAU-GS5]|nr:DUF742 domain-containing protein [Streptosporangiaceae bacterium NEAU-GS5]
MNGSADEPMWVGDEAGPVVRAYVVTGGRTEPTRSQLDLITIAVAVAPVGEHGRVGPEHPEYAIIAELCREPQSVAEIAALTTLPAGVIRVLLSDLVDAGVIELQEPHVEAAMHGQEMYRALLDGLRAL